MVDMIDVHGLPGEDIKFVEKIVNLLRDNANEKGEKVEKEDIKFAAWPSDVKGRITREEIYDYL